MEDSLKIDLIVIIIANEYISIYDNMMHPRKMHDGFRHRSEF